MNQSAVASITYYIAISYLHARFFGCPSHQLMLFSIPHFAGEDGGVFSMRRIAVSLVICILAAEAVQATRPEADGELTSSLPAPEMAILLSVGREYNLSGNALKLLFVIRKIENGPPGVEMGVASNFPKHRARRFAGNHSESLRIQARWAAGTIRKHYNGDLAQFARRYCPPRWEHWATMADYWMAKA
jgi:hypothetical protein